MKSSLTHRVDGRNNEEFDGGVKIPLLSPIRWNVRPHFSPKVALMREVRPTYRES
ncbi:MAG: hypothetical protein ACE5HC_14960 [Candidatus Binatia bacterium]